MFVASGWGEGELKVSELRKLCVNVCVCVCVCEREREREREREIFGRRFLYGFHILYYSTIDALHHN